MRAGAQPLQHLIRTVSEYTGATPQQRQACVHAHRMNWAVCGQPSLQSRLRKHPDLTVAESGS